MNDYQIIVSREAELDIREAFLWYENKSPGLGYDLLLSIEDSLLYIRKNPIIYQIKYKGIRRAFIKRFPYGIFYSIDDSNKKIHIIAVFHAHRSPISWKRRNKS